MQLLAKSVAAPEGGRMIAGVLWKRQVRELTRLSPSQGGNFPVESLRNAGVIESFAEQITAIAGHRFDRLAAHVAAACRVLGWT